MVKRLAYAMLLLFLAAASGDGAHGGAPSKGKSGDRDIVIVCPVDRETFQVSDQSRPSGETERNDNFGYFLPLYTCPRCGLTLPLVFFESFADGRAQQKLTDKLSPYIHSEEFKTLFRSAPPYYVFMRTMEEMDPKALDNNPPQLFFLGFGYASAVRQAEGNPIFGNSLPPNPEYVALSLKKCRERVAEGIKQLENNDEIAHNFPSLVLRGIYTGVNANRRLGDFGQAGDMLAVYRKYAERFKKEKNLWPTDEEFSLADINAMADRQATLIRKKDSKTKVETKKSNVN